MPINIIPTSAAEHLLYPPLPPDGMRFIFSKKNKDNRRYFPDGEVYTRLFEQIELRGERAVILHSGQPNVNDGLIELYQLLDIIKPLNEDKYSKPSSLEVFFTYFPYAAKDKIFNYGELNAAECLVKKLIDYYGVDGIYTIDAHFLGKEWVSNYPITNISAVGLLKEAAKKDYPDIIFRVPDEGSQKRTGIEGTKKKRLNSYSAKLESDAKFRRDVYGQTVGVIDDMLRTGGTLCSFYDECKKYGAKEVVALITHGVILEGINRIKKQYDKLYLTNTIDRKEANVDITGLVLETIKDYKD